MSLIAANNASVQSSAGGRGSKPGKARRTAAQSVRSYLAVATVAGAVLLVGVGGWAATANISGAVFAVGEVVIEGRSHAVQHPDGGLIETVHVRDGDHVSEGDVLFELDPARLQATQHILSRQVAELEARQTRLQAERDGLGGLPVRGPRVADPSDYEELLTSEQRLFEARAALLEGQVEQTRKRIGQITDEIEGLTVQRDANIVEIDLIEQELAALNDLLDQGLVQANRVLALERNAAQLAGQRGAFDARIAQARGQISELELQLLQIANDW